MLYLGRNTVAPNNIVEKGISPTGTLEITTDGTYDVTNYATVIVNTASGTVLHRYDRVNNKATVAGFWTDGNGQKYAVCVVDAQYRKPRTTTFRPYWCHTNYIIDTPLPNYTSETDALNATESATYNYSVISSTYSDSNYMAFREAHGAVIVEIDTKLFYSELPTLAELKMLKDDAENLDTYDPTITEDYKGLVDSGCLSWSSTECSEENAWVQHNTSGRINRPKNNINQGIIPIIEIPVDSRGMVI